MRFVTCVFLRCESLLLKRYLLWFCFPFVLTAIFCGVCKTFFELSFLISAFVGVSVFLLLRKNGKLPAVLLIAAVAASLIWQSIYFSRDTIPHELLKGETSLNVTATSFSEPTSSGDKISFRAKYVSEEKDINLIVYSKDAGQTVKPGDKLEINARVFEFENSEFYAEKTYYKSRYLDASANATCVKFISSEENSKFLYFPEYAAHYMKVVIDKLYSPKHSAFLKALVLGDSSGLDDDFSKRLRKTGMSHTVSVSGMHISFIIGFLLLFAKNKYIKIFAIPVMFLFAVMVGAPQSALRAAIMQSLLIIADLKKREYDPLTAISFAAFVLVLINPYCATDIAFLLSFSATLGIVLLFPKLFSVFAKVGKNIPGPLRKGFNALISVVAVSISASLFTSPITAYTFNSVSLIAPFSNVLLSFLITVVFTLGSASVLIGFVFSPLGKLLAIIPGFVIELIMNIIRFLSNFQYSEIFTGDMVVILAIVFLAAIAIYSILAGRKKVRPLFSVLLAVGFLFGVLTVKSADPSQNAYEGVRFDVLDVGQGQCVVATSGDECVVIDCGGEGDADFIAASHLIRRGIYDIDALILTHAHSDHANGTAYLTDTIKTKSVYLPENDRDNATFVKLSERLGGESEFVYVEEDTTFMLSDMKIKILALPEGRSENENGLVVLVCDGEYEMLITGDLPSKLEKTISEKIPDCESYIVGHHGSKSSSSQALLNKALPELCIISVGEGNSYGHPSGETLDKLRRIGAEIKRTDLDGTITVYSRR